MARQLALIKERLAGSSGTDASRTAMDTATLLEPATGAATATGVAAAASTGAGACVGAGTDAGVPEVEFGRLRIPGKTRAEKEAELSAEVAVQQAKQAGADQDMYDIIPDAREPVKQAQGTAKPESGRKIFLISLAHLNVRPSPRPTVVSTHRACRRANEIELPAPHGVPDTVIGL